MLKSQAIEVLLSKCEEVANQEFEAIQGQHFVYYKQEVDIAYDFEWKSDALQRIFKGKEDPVKQLEEENNRATMEIIDYFRDEAYRYFSIRVFREEIEELIEAEFLDRYEAEAITSNWFSDRVYQQIIPDLRDLEIDINISGDITDANVDYTTCVAGPHYAAGDIGISEEWFWVALAIQQGYTLEQVQQAVDGKNSHGSKFLASLYTELANQTAAMGAFTFFVKMPLRDAAKLASYVRGSNEVPLYARYDGKSRNDCGNITIHRNTSCGFLDQWSGSGSMIDVFLEKDVILPVQYIGEIVPDSIQSPHSAWSIYGCDFWDGEVVEMNLKRGWGDNGEQ